jgi:hypothetical protein
VYVSLHGEGSALGSQADRYANESLDQISDDELLVNAPQDESQQDKESRRQRNRHRATRRKNAIAWAQRAPTPHGPRNLRQDLDEADDNAFDSLLINLAEAAILMQALPDTPQIREIQRLTRDALRQIGRQNLAPFVSHNSRTPAKQKGHQEANQGNNPHGQPWPRYQDESYYAGPSRSHGRFPNDARDFLKARRHGRPADETDRFPAFSHNINYAEYPTSFSPVNMQNLRMYDGKQDPRQWLRIYSTTIEVAGGTNSTKVIYIPMALESTPLTWLETLRHDSIHSWEDLKKIFIDNFQGSIHRPATRHDLRLCKQERGEALRSYINRFFDTRATIANIADDDVIDCFHNGLAAQQLYRDFGRNRPRSVVALRDMMLAWGDQEEQERDRFP